MKSDWHTHNSLCRHAQGKIEDYVEKALDYDLGLLGCSDHFSYDYLLNNVPNFDDIPYQEYSMRASEINGYVNKVLELKERYHDKIQIKLGFEVDFFENQEKNTMQALKTYIDNIDYIYGSVHVLRTENGLFAFDDSRFLKKYNQFDNIDEIYVKYYNTLQKMITSSIFACDIVSHFDLPKKFNKAFQDHGLIMEKVSQTLELIKKKKLVIEINSSGFRKEINEQYPSEEIIKLMYELDIPVLLGSDAHQPEELAYKFKSIIKLLKTFGYDYLTYFDKRKKSFIEMD